jgi:mono/diheme cytochrome c family protein
MLCLGLVALAVAGLRVAAEAVPSAASGPQEQRSIWDGVYTEEQAARGGRIYVRSCGQCHSDDLSGGGDGEPPLAGVLFMSQWSGSTVGDLVERISESMPYTAPGSLPGQEYVDVVSYILAVNGAPSGQGELPSNRAKLEQIRIIERVAAQWTGRPGVLVAALFSCC